MTKYSLGSYEKYKNSNVEWIGNTPIEWTIVRNKDIFAERGQLSVHGNETLLTVSHITGVTRRDEKSVNMFMAENMQGYKICKIGDFVINTMWAWMGALGTCNEEGICSPAYGVYMPKKGVPYDHRYFDYLYRTPSAVTEMTRNSKGIVSSRLRLYPKEFFQIFTSLPDFNTQKRIADYLDEKIKVIDEKIKLLDEKAIKYRELRNSLIFDVLRAGIDNCKQFKDSDVKYLGEIPFDWNVFRLKEIVRKIESGSRDKGGAADEGFMSISAEHISWDGKFDFSNEKYISHEHYKRMSSGKIRIGDVLLTKDGATIGKCAYYDMKYFENVAINEHMYLLRNNKRVASKFLYYLIFSKIGQDQIRKTMKSSAIPGINSSFATETYFALPDKDEQLRIVEYLDKKVSRINQIIKRIEIQGIKLQEHKTVLISDIVKGKIKVEEGGHHE